MKKKTILLIIILLATAMASRKQFDLDPYTNSNYFPHNYIVTSIDNNHEKNHPLYSSEGYVPPSMKLMPREFLFSPSFHVFSAIAFWAFTIGGVFFLIRMGGFTVYQSMTMTLFSLFVGNLVIRELLDITLLPPAPYVGWTHYNMRTPIIPLSVLGLTLVFKRRFIFGGLLIGLATFFHVKFGIRFFGLIFLSLLLWKYWGSSRVGLSQKDISWRNIVSFAVSWGVLFVITYFQIKSGMRFYDSLDLPQSQPLINQLAWLIKNEPDDYLVSYHFLSSKPFFGFLCMAIAIGAFCETIIRHSSSEKIKRFAVLWEISTLVAVIFWSAGFLFESLLIDWLPLRLAHSITLIRFWDLTWVVVLGFWITFFAVVAVMAKGMMVQVGKIELIASNIFFHLVMAFFLCANIAIFVKNKDGELVTGSGLRGGKVPILKIMNYTQICDKESSEYNKVYREAISAIQIGDEKRFQDVLFRLNAIYDEFKMKSKNLLMQNPDVSHLKVLNLSMNGNFSKYISESTKFERVQREDAYWWSCFHSEPGVHNRSVTIPAEHYLNAAGWVKDNLPLDKAVIQPPYLGKFTLHSKHVAFWDNKIDQHMMYTIKGYYGMGLHRLQLVAGPQAVVFEMGTSNGDLGPQSREHFLKLTKKDIVKIREDYPGYDYLLTENRFLDGYPIIYSNPSLVLYDVSAN